MVHPRAFLVVAAAALIALAAHPAAGVQVPRSGLLGLAQLAVVALLMAALPLGDWGIVMWLGLLSFGLVFDVLFLWADPWRIRY